MDEYDSRLMERALGAARSAMQNGENPIGCVLAVDGGGYAPGAINAGLTNKLIVHGPTAHDQVVKLFQEYLTISRNEGGIQYARSLLAFHDIKEG